MKPQVGMLLIIWPLCASSQEQPAGIDVAGLTITPGMPEEAIRFELAYPYGFKCDKDGGESDVRYCRITSEEDDNVGEVFIKDGRVVSATRFVGEVVAGEYDGVRILYDLLSELTEGTPTCAIVSTGSHPLQIAIELPETTVSLMLHSRGDERFLAVREGLRWNRTPQIELEDCWPGPLPDGPTATTHSAPRPRYSEFGVP